MTIPALIAPRKRMQCTIGISQRVAFSARISRAADIESIVLHKQSRAGQ
jgi:hypothetical protein